MRRRQQTASTFDRLKEQLGSMEARLGEPAVQAVAAENRTRLVGAIRRFNRIMSPDGMDEYDLQQALSDAGSLTRLLDGHAGGATTARLLQTQMDRISDKLFEILLSLPERYAAPLTGGRAAVVRESNPALTDVAASYGSDAASERRTSLGFTILAVLLLVGAVGAAYWIVQEVSTADPTRVWASALGPTIVCATIALAAILSFRQATNHRRASREYIRLQRGFLAIPEYLAPLPPEVQHLLRATMTQSLFPRLLEDDDPVRQAAWPESDAMLQAIFGRDDEDDEETRNA